MTIDFVKTIILILALASVAGAQNPNALDCPQMPAGTNSTNVPVPMAPRKQLVWLERLLQETPNVRVLSTPHFLIRVRQDPNKQIIFLRGTFTNADTEEISKLSQLLIQDKSTVVWFNFGGGSSGAIMRFADIVRNKCSADRGCVVRTELPAGNMCASYCIPLFMMGQVRVAEEGAQFGFHVATVGSCKMPGDAERAYQDAGLSPAWLETHHSLFLEREITALGPLEVRGSGLVTEIIVKAPEVQLPIPVVVPKPTEVAPPVSPATEPLSAVDVRDQILLAPVAPIGVPDLVLETAH